MAVLVLVLVDVDDCEVDILFLLCSLLLALLLVADNESLLTLGDTMVIFVIGVQLLALS
jgi:hypothetical protein